MAYYDHLSGRHPVGKGDQPVKGHDRDKYAAGWDRIFGNKDKAKDKQNDKARD